MTQHVIRNEQASMPCLIESVTGVWKFHNWSDERIYAYSPPGHLFHYMISGSYHLQTNGREYDIKPGQVIYYHEVEEVTVECGDEPIEFYSIGFSAPDWPTLPLSMRVFHGGGVFRKLFSAAYDAFSNSGQLVNQARLSANLYRLLELVENRRDKIEPLGKTNHSLWWEVENTLIRNRNFHASIDDMTGIALVSRSTLNRICNSATGLSPRQRVIQLRMNHARGLLRYSSLSVSLISKLMGYSRVNEFSREYSKIIGMPPSRDRKAGR